ncbi:MAG TPA: porin [Hyphomicrobium sp.]|nr:porin [Hyphomicrobium sp.]
MIRLKFVAAAAAACAFSSTTFAADLGGNCCADLEERIAELEATTARKGNRKVSLTVSGWVNQAIFMWDDGVERNAYVGTNGLEQDRFRFVGEAKIIEGWSAGYTLEIGLDGANSKLFSQTSDGNVNDVVDRRASWFVKSKDYGKVTIGKDANSTYHLLDNVDFTLTRNVSDAEATGVYLSSFILRSDGALLGTTKWTDIMGGFNNATPGQPGLRNVVAYETPTFAGFSAGTSWGEDDMWDVALAYKNDIGDFKVSAKIGYSETTDPATNGGQCAIGIGTGDCQYWGGAAVVMHTPTGLYVYGAYSENKIDPLPGAVNVDDTSTMFFIQAGIEQKWISLGKTNFFAEYRNDDVGLSKSADESDMNFWAAGIVQNIENADLSLYAQYRHFDGDFTDAGAKTNLDALDMVITGAKMNF